VAKVATLVAVLVLAVTDPEHAVAEDAVVHVYVIASPVAGEPTEGPPAAKSVVTFTVIEPPPPVCDERTL